MPYIKQKNREYVNPAVPEIAGSITDAGELAYALTRLFLRYWRGHGKRFQAASDIAGAVHWALHEFGRRIVDPHEDEKIKENGDVY